MFTIQKMSENTAVAPIDKDKYYSVNEVQKILNYKKNTSIFYLIDKWYFDGFVQIEWGTPRYKIRKIKGEGIIKFIEERTK